MNKHKAQLIILINALIFPLFVLFFYSRLPESIPMQFSMSGKVNWSLPLNTALLAFSAFLVLYIIIVFIRHQKATVYPNKELWLALLLPELFVCVLSLAMIIQ